MLFRTMLLNTTLIFAGVSLGEAQQYGESAGAVFVATNNAKHNEVIMFSRPANGKLNRVGRFPTGGRGQGGVNDPLQSNYSVALNSDHSYLLVANAGTSDISVFRVLPYGLALTSVTPSGGGNPVSIAMHDDLVYVVNTGGNIHTAGFRLRSWGELTPVPNSRKTLSSLDSGASTVAFNAEGSKLVVSERLANTVDVFTVDEDGSLSHPVFNKSKGMEPFGLEFSPQGSLLVTEATFGVGGSTTSSYTVNDDNTLTALSATVPAGGGAACWIASNGAYAWVSNTGTSDIGAYSLGGDGSLTPMGVVATVPATEPTIFPPINPPTSFPLDLALTQNNEFLYVIFSGTGDIVGYRVKGGGKLEQVVSQKYVRPQIGAEGLAVY